MDMDYSYDPAKFKPQRLLALLQKDIQPGTQYNSVEYIMGRIVTALITEVGGGDTIISTFLRAMEEREQRRLEKLTQNPLYEQRLSQYLELCRLFPKDVEIDRTARESDWFAMNNLFRALLGNSKLGPNTPIVNEEGKPLQQHWLYVIYSKNQGFDRREKGGNTVNEWLGKCLQDIESAVDRLLQEQSIRFSLGHEEEMAVGEPSQDSSKLPQFTQISLAERTKNVIVKMHGIKDVILLEKNISHGAEGSSRSLEGTFVGQICKKYDALAIKNSENIALIPPLSQTTSLPDIGSAQHSLLLQSSMMSSSSSSSKGPDHQHARPPMLNFQSMVSAPAMAPMSVLSPRIGLNQEPSEAHKALLANLERQCTDKLISLYGAINGAVKARWVLARLLSMTLDIPLPPTPPIATIQKLSLDGLSEEQFRSQFNDIVQSWVVEKAIRPNEPSIPSTHYEEIKMGLQSYLEAINGLNELGREVAQIRLHISILDQSQAKSFGHQPSPRLVSPSSRTPRSIRRDLSSMLRGFGSLFNLITACLHQAAGASPKLLTDGGSSEQSLSSEIGPSPHQEVTGRAISSDQLPKVSFSLPFSPSIPTRSRSGTQG